MQKIRDAKLAKSPKLVIQKLQQELDKLLHGKNKNNKERTDK